MKIFTMNKESNGSSTWQTHEKRSVADMSPEELREFIRETMGESENQGSTPKERKKNVASATLKATGRTAHAITDVLSESVHAIIDIVTVGKGTRPKKGGE